MASQSFKRYELKYFLTKEQKEKLVELMTQYMKIDKYGRSTIQNIYLDTPDYRLIRRSIEKPMYKEKLRIRSYGNASDDSSVFVEIKKKYDSIVYKRRISLSYKSVIKAFTTGSKLPITGQIANEIEYFRNFYAQLRPGMYLSYEREAYKTIEKSDFRITFDENILYRNYDFTLCKTPYGEKLIGDDDVLMEIKTSGGIPLWLVEFLSEEKIYKTSFSKYGTAYKRMHVKEIKEAV